MLCPTAVTFLFDGGSRGGWQQCVPEEVKVHSMPLAGICCISFAGTAVLSPDAGEVLLDHMIQHDGQHLGLQGSVFGVRWACAPCMDQHQGLDV